MTDKQRVVLLDGEAAEELLDLVRDEPGDADEARLAEAREALETAGKKLSGPDQQKVATGEAVAFGIAPDEAEIVETLITDNVEKDPRTLRQIGNTIMGKLQIARRKRKERRNNK